MRGAGEVGGAGGTMGSTAVVEDMVMAEAGVSVAAAGGGAVAPGGAAGGGTSAVVDKNDRKVSEGGRHAVRAYAIA